MNSPRNWRGRVFIGVSLDGYIARPDSNLDWLTDPPSDIDHEHITSDRLALEWNTFLPHIDHIVMGRGTYEKGLTFDHWPYTDQHVIVLSTTINSSPLPKVTVAHSLKEATSMLSQHQAHDVYVDGGKTVQAFLEADLVDEITVAIAPVLIGTGIPLFSTLSHDIRLRLRAAHASNAGMTHATYDIVR
jgi:dihydrofolate reductase